METIITYLIICSSSMDLNTATYNVQEIVNRKIENDFFQPFGNLVISFDGKQYNVCQPIIAHPDKENK